MKITNKQSGFTIIELSISMAMLSVLLLIILFSILNITGVYNKGITLKRVNQSGRSISAEVQADLRQSTPNSNDSLAGAGSNFAVRDGQLAGKTVHTGICTGHNSYLWNVWGEGGSNTGLNYDGTSELITMIKLKDSGGVYCKAPFPLPTKAASSVVVGDDLAIREPVKVERGMGDRLIRFTFTISTPDDNSEIIYDSSGRGTCGAGQENNFCALNTFVVTSYAKGI